MEDRDQTTDPRMRLRDYFVVSAFLLVFSAVGFLALKFVWGEQQSWTVTLIAIPVVALVAILVGCYRLPRDNKNKK